MSDERRRTPCPARDEDRLRSLAIGDDPTGWVGATHLTPLGGLDAKLRTMVVVAAVIATGGGSSSYRRCVAEALTAGATPEEIVDVLVEIAPTVGLAGVGEATTELGAALGYDIDVALEGLEPPGPAGPL